MKLSRSQRWTEVSGDSPCPICCGEDACKVLPNGGAWCCRESDAPAGFRKVRRVDSGFTWFVPQRMESTSRDAADLASQMERLVRATSGSALRRYAASLGASNAETLQRYGCAVAVRNGRTCLAIPERDADWNIIGVMFRAEDGTKRVETGSQRGIIGPCELRPTQRVVILEGGSDTLTAAALASEGVMAIGRSSIGSNFETIRAVCKRVGASNVFIVRDADDTCEETGGAHLGSVLAGDGLDVRVVSIPGSKDLREWARATPRSQADFNALLETGESANPVAIMDRADPMGNARALLRKRPHIRVLRGVFHVYRDGHYPPEDGDSMRAFVWTESEKAEDLRGGTFRPTGRFVTETMDAMRAVAHLPSDRQPPFFVDAPEDDQARDLVVLRNGILNIPTGKMLPHTPRLFTPYALGFEFDPASQCPRWRKCIEHWFGGDAQQVSLLQEWCGYCLVARTHQQKALLLWGEKRSGKGTICRVQTRLLGPTNVAYPTLQSLAGEFGLQPLRHKLLAIFSDARLQSGGDAAVSKLLAITGEDAVSVNIKFETPVTERLQTRVQLISNEVPRLRDASAAIVSRFLPLRTEGSVFGREDPGLTDKLYREMPGILNWALAGLRRLTERGHFVVPDATRQVLDDMAELSSPVAAFVGERCVVGREHRIRCSTLYHEWRMWCARTGTFESSAPIFARDLHAFVPSVRTIQSGPGEGGEGRRMFVGVTLREWPRWKGDPPCGRTGANPAAQHAQPPSDRRSTTAHKAAPAVAAEATNEPENWGCGGLGNTRPPLPPRELKPKGKGQKKQGKKKGHGEVISGGRGGERPLRMRKPQPTPTFPEQGAKNPTRGRRGGSD